MNTGQTLRVAVLSLGIAMALLGAWWMARSQGYGGADFMAKDMQWLWRGLALAAFGGVMVVVSRRI